MVVGQRFGSRPYTTVKHEPKTTSVDAPTTRDVDAASVSCMGGRGLNEPS